MRIVWRDYVKSQMAWGASLAKLADDPSVGNRAYLAEKATAAYGNANAVIRRQRTPSRPKRPLQ